MNAKYNMACLGIKKDIQTTVKEEDKPEPLNKSYKTVWCLEPTSAWGVDINNTSQFPPFVLKAVKVYLLYFKIIFYTLYFKNFYFPFLIFFFHFPPKRPRGFLFL